MRFRLTEDQRALRDGVRELLARRFGQEALRAAVERPGLDRGLWRELGAAGFFALRLPEAEGGVGLGLPEAVLVFEEAGRALVPGPLVATHLAAGTVPGAATGEAVVTAVGGGGLVEWLAEADAVVDTAGDVRDAGDLSATGGLRGAGDLREAEGPQEFGELREAGDLPEAGCLRGTGGQREIGDVRGTGDVREIGDVRGTRDVRGTGGRREAGGPSVAVEVRSVDPLTPLHRVPGGGSDDRLDDLFVLLTAAEQVGTAVRACEAAVQHARTREQFGRPVGAFQAVKHLCAELLVRVEVARAALYAAAVTADPVDIAVARLLADEAAVRGARDCLQVHGGMGFTWEADVHLCLKRAWVRAERGGSITESEELLARELLSEAVRPR
ncbi:acyl-CoA dehydrogenase family protein [Streptomyces sp. VNUA24]|uniref:acyl-CoA dehydrogenase family protein n=2 Tax=unclassified Streptomyces TaxID=2593676 RepID=UPI0023B836E0|nr:acyl-CoA dehydrogenase family protein [Streptomyces sp. VNUA24]WEH17271.1 acyl-CoA/acyl-ACP dehydrogenase [Streptomyces sp. VNUA24]